MDDEREKRLAELGIQIFNSALASEKLKELSNERIGELLFEFVWAEMDAFSIEGCLIDEAISRLGFVPDVADNIVPTRCPVCGWRYSDDGCKPGNCSQRPQPKHGYMGDISGLGADFPHSV
jgi:hypothetical protein